MRSRVVYGSFLVYAPRPQTPHARAVKNFVVALKQDRPLSRDAGLPSDYLAAKMAASLAPDHALRELFADAVLVPAPGSAPLTKNALWAPRRIAAALCASGFGRQVHELLEREHPVRRSHQVAGVERPWPDTHRASLRVHHLVLPVGSRIVVVDDVVTRGSTLLGCVWRLKDDFPESDVVGFAAVRTVQAEPDPAVQPTIGEIRYQPGWIDRTPS